MQGIGRNIRRHRERNDTAVQQANLDLTLAGIAEHDRGRPMHVVKRQLRALQRDLPDRLHHAPAAKGARALLGLDAHGGFAEIYFRAAVAGAAADGFVARQAVLQRLFGGALKLGVDGRLDREGFRGQRLHADQRLRLAHQMVDEVEAGLAARPLIGHDARHRRDAGIDRSVPGTLSSCMRLST